MCLPAYLLYTYKVRHYQYAVHRSRAYLSCTSLAATLNLLLLRWVARDFEAPSYYISYYTPYCTPYYIPHQAPYHTRCQTP